MATATHRLSTEVNNLHQEINRKPTEKITRFLVGLCKELTQ